MADIKSEKLLVSVVLPCRNEMAALPYCLQSIQAVFSQHNINGEIIVSDSSTDQSPNIAQRFGAKLIKHNEDGYGTACRHGLAAASGEYIFLADSDGSYDFFELPKFIELLKSGNEMVVGNRFGGMMDKGAMPWIHHYIGNPLLSAILRFLFRARVTDVHCGMKALTRQAFVKLNLKTSGMEFASEMVISAVRKKMKIAEVPINYHVRKGKSKLKPLADGWRHLRFMLLYSPLFLFFFPGLMFFIVGLVISVAIYFDMFIFWGRQFSYHPMFLGSILVISGYQLMFFALFAKTYALTHLGEQSVIINFAHRFITIEKASFFGLAVSFIGVAIYGLIFWRWFANGFGELAEIKNSILALTLVVVGLQTIFSAFMLSILGIKETN